MKKTAQKILVTGGAGFIGSHLSRRLLSEGFEVISVDNFNDFYDPQIKEKNIQTIKAITPFGDLFLSIQADIRNRQEMLVLMESLRPDAVIHLAAMAGVRPSIENPALYTEVNIVGTQNLLDACAVSQVKHFLFASSSSVYGNNPKVPFSETDFVDHPISPYAATKRAGELICYTYSHLHQIQMTCLRFFTVYGPGQRPDLAIHKFAKLMLDGKEIPFFGDGNMQRDYTYVDDIVDGVLSALERNLFERGPAYEIFNLGGSRTVTLNEMLRCLEKSLNLKAKIKPLPMQRGDVQRTNADLTRSGRLLGFSPKTQFEDGIQRFVDWFYSYYAEAVSS